MATPNGITMNSCMSTASACEPPLMMFIMGQATSVRRPRPDSGKAACRSVRWRPCMPSHTARIALGPSLFLFSVPSSSIILSSISTWSRRPCRRAPASLLFTLCTALQHALAEISRLVTVAKFQGLVDAGAGAAGNGRPAERAVGQFNVHLDGRVSAAVQDSSGTNVEIVELMADVPIFSVFKKGVILSQRRFA